MFGKNKRILTVGLILTLALGLTAIPMLGNGDSSESEGTDRFAILSRAAEILGLEEEELTNAFEQAFLEVATERIDELVDEGRIDEERAEWMKEELKERVEDGVFPRMFEEGFGSFGGKYQRFNMHEGYRGAKRGPDMMKGRGRFHGEEY